MAESPRNLELWSSRKTKKEVKMTSGIETGNGARPNTEAMAKALNAT